jgi:hypothetical protein
LDDRALLLVAHDTESDSTLSSCQAANSKEMLFAENMNSTVQTERTISCLHGPLLLDVGATATFLTFGVAKPARLDLGWDILPLTQPGNAMEVQRGLEAVLHFLACYAGNVIHDAALGRRALLLSTPFYEKLLSLEALHSGDTQVSALEASFLSCLLNQAGLAWLQCHTPEAALRQTVGSLLTLSALARFLAIERLEFSAPLQPEAAILSCMQRMQAMAYHEGLARVFYERLVISFPENFQRLRHLFPVFCHQLEGRVKDIDSIAHKLNERLSPENAQPLATLRQAENCVNDGHGFTIALQDPSRENLVLIREVLLRAIRTGDLEVSAVKNYRSAALDCLPYFEESDIEQLWMAIEWRRLRSPPVLRSSWRAEVAEGQAALKSSGYTTTQLTIRLRNPQTGEFDLPEVDLHICGEKVYQFYRGADHLVYDIREGKDLFKHNPYIRAQFKLDVQPLLEAIQRMPQACFMRFTEYRQQIYTYLRLLESGDIVLSPPAPPEGLPTCCHLDNLTRLSHLQRALIQEAAKNAPGLEHASPEKLWTMNRLAVLT